MGFETHFLDISRISDLNGLSASQPLKFDHEVRMTLVVLSCFYSPALCGFPSPGQLATFEMPYASAWQYCARHEPKLYLK